MSDVVQGQALRATCEVIVSADGHVVPSMVPVGASVGAMPDGSIRLAFSTSTGEFVAFLAAEGARGIGEALVAASSPIVTPPAGLFIPGR